MAEDRSTRTREATRQYWDQPGPVRYSRAEVNAPMIWGFCEAVQDGNPVYWDEEFARRTRFGRLIAPPHMIMTMSSGHWWAPEWLAERERAAESKQPNPGDEVMRIVRDHGFTTATNVTREDEFVEPYGPGDGRLLQQSRVIDVSEEKQTRVGKGVFITSMIEYRTERDDRLVVRAKNVLLMYDSSQPRGD